MLSKMRPALLISFLLYFLEAGNAFGQTNYPAERGHDYIFRYLDNSDGLLHNEVNAITQDKRGYIWLGTPKGLQRYDGSRMVHYRDPTMNAGESIIIAALQANDSNHSILLQTRDQQFREFHWVTNQFVLKAQNEKSLPVESGSGSTANDINQDPFFKLFSARGTGPWHKITDKSGDTWVYGSGEEFFRYENRTAKIFSYSLRQITQARGNDNGEQAASITCIITDNHGAVWMGTDNAGLLQYNAKANYFSVITNKQSSSPGVNYTYTINCLFQDREDNIWIGTDKGVSIFNPYKQYFKAIRHEENNPNSLPKKLISAVIEIKTGDLLVGTVGGGITVYDKQWRFKKNIRLSTASRNEVYCFLEDDDGKIWTGCAGGIVELVDPDNFTNTSLYLPGGHNATITTISKDKQGNMLLGLYNGNIVKWDKKKKQFCQYENNDQGIGRSAPINQIFYDSYQQCWISSFAGLSVFNAGTGATTAEYVPKKGNVNSISSKHCFGIEQLNDSILAIGTGNGGLNLFNRNTRQFHQVAIDGHKEMYSAFAVKKDDGGNIWFTTDYDIYKFDPATQHIFACKLERGLINSFFRPSGFLGSRDGQWVTWTYAEVLAFNPDSISAEQKNIAPVMITDFKVFDHAVLLDTMLQSGNPIQLSYQQNFVTIEFASLSFLSANKLNYRYRLVGVDDDWVTSGTKQFASYTKLNPGRYSFRVTTAPGDDNQKVTVLNFVIAPPFWGTWWFRLLAISLLMFTVYLLVRRRFDAIRHESAMKQRIAETEMMALRAQMNPHFIFNCLSAIDNLIQTNQQEKATRYLSRFAKLIRSILHSSKNTVVPFQEDLETLELYLQLEQFRSNNKFHYQVEVDPMLLDSDYNVPPMIVQPFLENAIHHGLLNKPTNDRLLKITIRLIENHIRYSITDNGVGREEAGVLKSLNRPEHVSYGIQITRDRVQLHNHSSTDRDVIVSDLVVDGEPAGTLVEVRINVEDDNYRTS